MYSLLETLSLLEAIISDLFIIRSETIKLENNSKMIVPCFKFKIYELNPPTPFPIREPIAFFVIGKSQLILIQTLHIFLVNRIITFLAASN